MKPQEILNAIEENPIITAVKDEAGLEACLRTDSRIVFILYGDICSICSIVRRVKHAGKIAIVHADLLVGLGSKEVAADFLKSQADIDGMISTKPALLKRAKELGLENTHFSNCSGLFDDGAHFTTAYDVALMSRELIKHDLIKDYTTIWMDSIRGGKFELSNTNKLVYWYQGCTGLKTGYTSTAMYCLSATAERDGVEYIAVVMHGDSIESRNNDAKALLNYGFASFTLCPLHGAELPDIPVELGRSGSVRCEYDGGEYALVPKTGAEPEYELTLPERVAAPVAAGARLGTLWVSVGGELLREVPVVAAEDVARLGYFGLWGKLALSLFGV